MPQHNRYGLLRASTNGFESKKRSSLTIDYGLSLVGSTSEYDGLRVWMISNQPTQATRGRGDGEIGRHIVLHIVAGHCELLQIAARVSIED